MVIRFTKLMIISIPLFQVCLLMEIDWLIRWDLLDKIICIYMILLYLWNNLLREFAHLNKLILNKVVWDHMDQHLSILDGMNIMDFRYFQVIQLEICPLGKLLLKVKMKTLLTIIFKRNFKMDWQDNKL